MKALKIHKDRKGKEIHLGDTVRSANGRMWEVKHGAYTIKDKKRFGWYIQGDGKTLPLEPSGALEIL